MLKEIRSILHLEKKINCVNSIIFIRVFICNCLRLFDKTL